MTTPISCDISDHFDDWVSGNLAPSGAEQVLTHVLSCPRCLALHWVPLMKWRLDQAEQFVSAFVGGSTFNTTVDGRLTFYGPPSMSKTTEPVQADNDSMFFKPTQVFRGGLRRVGTVLPMTSKKMGIQGYRLYLSGGVPSPIQEANSSAMLDVHLEGEDIQIFLKSLGGICILDSEPLPKNRSRLLRYSHTLVLEGGTYLLEQGAKTLEDAWRGSGVIRHSSIGYQFMGRVSIGRLPNCDIALEDRRITSNVSYSPRRQHPHNPGKEVEMPYLDQISVHRMHAEMEFTASRVAIRACGKHPVFRMREGNALRLTKTDKPIVLKSGDLLRIGQGLFEVG